MTHCCRSSPSIDFTGKRLIDVTVTVMVTPRGR